MVGGDADAHGCITSAGYTWCGGQCVRPWESACEDLKETDSDAEKEEEREEGDEEEEEEEERLLKLHIIVLTVSCLVGVSLLFEITHEHLLEHTSETMRPIIVGLFGELTLLGFIGLTLFLLFKMAWPHELSEEVYGDSTIIPELGESVHMVLFLVMVIFLAQAVYLARLGDRVVHKWKAWESHSLTKVHERTIRKHKQLQGSSLLSLATHSLDEDVDALIFSLTRDRFCQVRRLHPADFEFASYLGIALGRTLEDLVEVPVKSWVCLEVVLLLAWQIDGLLGKREKMLSWILAGYALPLMAGLVLAKLRRILVQHTAPLLAEAEGRGRSGSLRAAANHSVRRVQNGSKSPSPTSPRKGVHVQKTAVNTTYHRAFWFGSKQKAKFTLFILRFVPLGAAIYIAILLLVHAPALIQGEVLATQPLYRRCIILGIALLPPVLCTFYVREAVDDFAIAGHVESLQNLRFVEHVIRRQRTVAAFEALKVVTFLRKPDVVRKVLESNILIDDEPDEREERSWRSIFDVFDSNGDGIFDRGELRVLLTKFSSGFENSDITQIIELLDADGSGEICFDEFYAFGRKLERHVRTQVDPRDLLREMFEIVDDDRGGLITVHELHQTIREIGQELSIDDVRFAASPFITGPMTSLPHFVPPNSQYCDDRTKRHPFTEDPPRGRSRPNRRASAAPHRSSRRSTTSSRILMMTATARSTSRSSTCSCTASASSSSASRPTSHF